MPHRLQTFTKFFKDSTDKVVIWQWPNIPLIGWAVFTALMHALPAGTWQQFAGLISFGFIFTWSWLEITQGASPFRRTLGAVVLAASIHASGALSTS